MKQIKRYIVAIVLAICIAPPATRANPAAILSSIIVMNASIISAINIKANNKTLPHPYSMMRGVEFHHDGWTWVVRDDAAAKTVLVVAIGYRNVDVVEADGNGNYVTNTYRRYTHVTMRGRLPLANAYIRAARPKCTIEQMVTHQKGQQIEAAYKCK